MKKPNVLKKFTLTLTSTDDGQWHCKSLNAGFTATELAYFFHDKTCDVFKQGMGLDVPKIKYSRTVVVCSKCHKARKESPK